MGGRIGYFLEAAGDRWRGAIFARGKYISLFNFAGGSIFEGKREIDSQRKRERERKREIQHPRGPSHENVESLTVSATVSLLSPLFVFDVSPRPCLPCERCISAPDRLQLDENRPSLLDFQLGTNKIVWVYQFSLGLLSPLERLRWPVEIPFLSLSRISRILLKF